MGVNTKKFGKYGWKVLEGLAKFFDDFLKDYNANKILCCKMICFFTEVISLIGFILPCVFCRVSFREFIHPNYDSSTNLTQYLKNGNAQKLIYNLHNCVNNKLEKQEIANAKNEDELFMIQEKWRQHYKPFCEVSFITIVDSEFWEAFLIFLGYVMCDNIEQIYIQRFLKAIGHMFSLVSNSADALSLMNGQISYSLSTIYNESIITKDRNITSIWKIGENIYRFFDWKQPFSFIEFHNICKNGIIVKCVK